MDISEVIHLTYMRLADMGITHRHRLIDTNMGGQHSVELLNVDTMKTVHMQGKDHMLILKACVHEMLNQ